MLVLLLPILFLEIPRYTLGAVALCLGHMLYQLFNYCFRSPSPCVFDYCPTITVVVAGLNEAKTLPHTLESLWGTYPRMNIVVVDDGSTDEMTSIAQSFADAHEGVIVLSRAERGGKSSALNYALPFADDEIVVCVDSDSHLAPNALWEIVQPFRDPRVGAVSGTVLARNAFCNLVTWLQAFEYLRCIFLGRMFASKIDILGITSGAFGAFRREALDRVGGWDVGPGEDGDLTLRIRKSGYRVLFAPYAQCFTNVPTHFWRLLKQRRRWEWAVITFECRKHVDMGSPLSPNFRFANLLLLIERWTFNVLLTFLFWAYLVWLAFHWHANVPLQLFTYYVIYVALDFLTLGVILYYSLDPKRDLIIGLIAPLMPFYQFVLRAVSLWAITEEIFVRSSFRDTFVPEHVRNATWHW
ncbi:MAG: glycosyltransferase family 2 protein [Pirellulales bacterium]|nr:glycosyltransferase family 2 protein [Pirellulales bacterium]